MADHLRHINRPLTDEQRRLAAEIQDGAKKDFPPKTVPGKTIPPGIPQRIHDARKRRGMTRYEDGHRVVQKQETQRTAMLIDHSKHRSNKTNAPR